MTTNNLLRAQAPPLQIADQVLLGSYRLHTLSNGIAVYITDNDAEDVVKIEMAYPAGRWYEPDKMVSRAVCRLLTKGTTRYSSKELADRIDFFGASVETSNGHDHTTVKIFSLGKYLKEILPLVREMLDDADFPEEELELFQKKQIQKLQVGLQNTDFVANRKFNEVVFGASHPYGYQVELPVIESLHRIHLLNFARKHYSPANAILFVSGKITPSVLELLETHLGSAKASHPEEEPIHSSIANPSRQFLELNTESVQSSIRIGGLTIGKQHPDYPELNVANTVLGGYFGSRLMSNIREDKGFTYGIYSMIRHYRHGSYFAVDTEVGNEVCMAAVEEIYQEMDKMGKEPVGMDELMVVRNYMMGSLIRATDGSFNRIQVIRNMVLSDLDFSYFDTLVHAIKTITPERIMELSQQYFQAEQYKEVICGNPEK
jgi:zinc protease